MIQSSLNLDFEWNEETKKNVRDSKVTYSFLPGTEFVHGKSERYQDLSLSIRFRVAQVYADSPPYPSSWTLFWSSSLESDFGVIVRGHQDTPLELGVVGAGKVFPIWIDTDRRKFKAKISSTDIRDGMPVGEFSACEFVIRFGKAWKQTGCMYLYEPDVETAILEADPSILEFLPSELRELIRDAETVVKSPKETFRLDDSVALPSRLKNFLLFLEAGLSIFDNNELLDLNDSRYTSIHYLNWLKWFQKCREDTRDSYSLLKNRPADEELPPIDRWKKKIEDLVAELSESLNLRKLIISFGKDLSDPFGPPTSKIAKMPNGSDLRRSTYYYKNRQYQDSYKISHQLAESDAGIEVLRLSSIFETLALIRLWRFPPKSLSHKSSNPWDLLSDIIGVLSSLFHNGTIELLEQRKKALGDVFVLLEILDENCFGRLLKCVSIDNWEELSQIAYEEPLIMYLLYRNDSMRDNTGLNRSEILSRLVGDRDKGEIPLRVELV